MKPSTYTATISTDQIIISLHDYTELVEYKVHLRQALDANDDLKKELAMVKDVLQRVMGFYGTSGNGNPPNVDGPHEDSKANHNDVTTVRSRPAKTRIRKDSGIDGIDIDETPEENENDTHTLNRGSPRDTITPLNVKRNESVSLPPRKRAEQKEDNLLDLDEDEPKPAPVKSKRAEKGILRNGIHESSDDQPNRKSQHYTREAASRASESSGTQPSSPPPVPRRTSSKQYREPEPTPLPRLQHEYESPVEEEERPPTPASWERAPAAPEVTFDDFSTNDSEWRKSTDWDPNPGVEKAKDKERATGLATGSGSWASGPPLIQPAKANVHIAPLPPPRSKTEESPPSPPKTPIAVPPSLKTARQLYMEKKLLARTLEARAEGRVDSSNASSSGDLDKLISDPDPSTFRHIYIPNLPSNATLATLSSIIRTNGKGGIEFISLFRQKAGDGDHPTFEDPGMGENIGVNITFTTAEACDVWFKFLFENSTQKLQGNPAKTWLFPNEESAAEWKKCAVFRRSDYHPSIAGKIDKGGPGGQAALADAQKKGATRVLTVTGLPPDVTESDLAFLSLPPGNRSSSYDGSTHLASGQAGLSTEEFARWKWLETIVLEEEETLGFGESGDSRKKAKIIAAGVKTAYLARGKIWKKYNHNRAILGKSSGGYVKVEFDKDECEGPLEEMPPWVVVGGDDDDLDSRMGSLGDADD